MKKNTQLISDKFIKTVSVRLAGNKQVRRSLPGWGRVHIDRQLPFLCIYRRRKDDKNSLTDGLITGEASYLTGTGSRMQHKQLSNLVKNIATTLKESFGSFLIVEVWAAPEHGREDELQTYNGSFKIIRPKKSKISSTIESLERSLKSINVRKKKSDVEIVPASKITHPGLPPLISTAEAEQLGLHILGIEVSPVYISHESDQVFPLIYRTLKRGLARALKNSFFEFMHNHTSHRPPHYQALGRRSMVKAVWDADRQFADICSGFDFLLQVTPVNSDAEWSTFKRNSFNKMPQFVYRPLSLDPALAKRQLYQIPIEKIEDPTLALLFRQHQIELDRKFTMLIDRGTRKFLYGSLQLYGGVDESLLNIALELLEKLSPRTHDESSRNSVDAKTFAIRAEQELAYFRKALPESDRKVVVRNDITGLMVSEGNLLIGAGTKIPVKRVEALIAHEVGTHVLTYLNGKGQPLRQLYIGFPGYDELQEGLAVLAEYLVGGLTRPRMRLLAARVIAAYQMTSGATFMEVFRELNTVYAFERRTSFNIAVRTFRGGGLTKDAVYLRGLVNLLEYLGKGGDFETLLVGKISADHVSIIKELQWRKVLQPPPLRPSYMEDQQALDKLNGLRHGLTAMNLIQRSK